MNPSPVRQYIIQRSGPNGQDFVSPMSMRVKVCGTHPADKTVGVCPKVLHRMFVRQRAKEIWQLRLYHSCMGIYLFLDIFGDVSSIFCFVSCSVKCEDD